MSRGYGPNKNDQHAWITRTGSRATVPSQRGHFRGLEPRIIDQTLPQSERRELLKEVVYKCEAELASLSRVLLRGKEYHIERNRIVAELTRAREELGKLKRERKALVGMHMHDAFVVAARNILDERVFNRILVAARKMMDGEISVEEDK